MKVTIIAHTTLGIMYDYYIKKGFTERESFLLSLLKIDLVKHNGKAQKDMLQDLESAESANFEVLYGEY